MREISAIKNWKSVRRYKEKRVEAEKLKAILEAGRRAPSWQNLQPWHFLMLDCEDAIKKISSIVVSNKVLLNAPAVIVVLGDMNSFTLNEAVERIKEQLPSHLLKKDIEKYLNNKLASPRLGSKEVLTARVIEQLSYACSFMILEASNQGLGSCVLGGVENILTERSENLKEVKKDLGIPENYELFTIITLGYADENPSQRSRKSMDSICSWNQFGDAQ